KRDTDSSRSAAAGEPETAAAVPQQDSSSDTIVAVGLAKRHKKELLAAGAALALVIAGLSYGISRFAAPAGGEAIDSVAVLPFENVGGDPETEYLSDGITETLINNLSRLPGLRVASRGSAFRFKGLDNDPRAAGKELNVDAVVTGRVLQRGDTLVIGAELVDVVQDAHLWGEQYNRRAADIFAVQEEIARDITQALRLKLSPEDEQRLSSRPTEVSEAYRHYLRGRFYWNRRTEEDIRKGLAFFEQAIAMDPNFALAYVGVADSYTVLTAWSVLPSKQAVPPARAAALKAVELDETLAEAHVSLAAVKQNEFDWQGAEQEFKLAIELNPRYATAHQWYAEILLPLGRHEEAEQAFHRALEIDPGSLIIQSAAGQLYYYWRQYDEAIKRIQAVIDKDPTFAPAYAYISDVYRGMEDVENELAAQKQFAVLTGGDLDSFSRQEHAFAEGGREGYLRAQLAVLEEDEKAGQPNWYALAAVNVRLGNKEAALDWLERCYRERGGIIERLKVDPMFDDLHDAPRFQSLLRRMNLPE
ncbi:MAG: tetratricopeptide repeat protein, partial [Nitrospiraceae bacterium]